jgi:nucleoside-diphosphate-sugar epimerase
MALATARGSGFRILVTGASGFIGRACLAPLRREGFQVDAISAHPQPMQEGVSWHCCDLLDAQASVALLEAIRPTHLLHAAWLAKPGAFWTHPDNFRWVTASLELFRAFYRAGGRRAVGVGTCAEYAWVTKPCNERTTPLHPATLYGRCKLAMSLLLEAAAQEAGGSAAWARLFLPYGPGEPAGRLIPAVIEGLLQGHRVACTHGTQKRDFIYINDVAEALVELACSTATGSFNVATGQGTSLHEVITCIANQLRGMENIDFGARPMPAGDPEYVVADTSHITSVTGWHPKHTLEQGIQLTIAATRDRLLAKEATQ